MFRKWYNIALASLLILGAVACSKESSISDEPAQGSGMPSELTLKISSGAPQSATKAVTETDEAAAGYENYIDVKNHLAVLFFDLSDKFMFQFTPTETLPVGSDRYPSEWTLRGPVSEPPTTGFKVVILANCPSSPEGLTKGVTTIDDVCKASWTMYTYNAPFTPSETDLIPMYGVKTFTSALKFRENLATDLGQIDLLRAMAKVEVTLGNGVDESLSDVRLVNYNPNGACAPLDMYVSTKNLDYGHSVHLYGGADDNPAETSSISFTSSSDGRTWTAYVPEYRNKDIYGLKRSDCSYIELNFEGITRTYTLDFRDYSLGTDNGKRFNLLRNHVYRYTIASVGGYELSLSLKAQPWSLSELSYDYKKTVSVSEQLLWTDSNHVTPIENGRVLAKGAGDLTCSFTIATPSGATWYAVFEEKSGDLNHFRFRLSDGTTSDYASGQVDGKAVNLEIVQDPQTVGTAKLVIYATYGNVNLAASDVLGGPWVLVKD